MKVERTHLLAAAPAVAVIFDLFVTLAVRILPPKGKRS